MQPSIIQTLGYVWLALPREGIMPLTLLEQTPQNIFQRIFGDLSVNAMSADIFSLFKKPTGRGGLPKVGKPRDVANFRGHDVLDAKAGINLEGLKALPEVANVDASAKLRTASKLLYTFKDVKSIGIETEVLLEEFLNIAHLAEAPGYVERLQNNQLYVVTEVLQTTEFSIQDASDFTISGNIDADALKGYVANLSANAKLRKDDSDKIAYKGAIPLTFALKACKIHYNKAEKKYSLSSKPIIKVLRSIEEIEVETLNVGNACLDL